MYRFSFYNVVFLVFILFASSVFGAVRYGGQGKWAVSIIELIMTPEKFREKPVIVSGYIKDSGGADLLYTTREYALMYDRSNAIALVGLSPDVVDPLRNPACDGRYASVHGKFQRVDRQLSYSGWAITEIEVIYVYSDFDDVMGATSTVCWGRKDEDCTETVLTWQARQCGPHHRPARLCYPFGL